MRQLWLLPLLLTANIGLAAAEGFPTGFLGISWGSSKEIFKESMLKREGVTFDETNSEENILIFDGGTFGGDSVAYITSFFFQNQLAKVLVVFKPKKQDVIPTYTQWVANLSGKYGKPTSAYKTFTTPYEEGDGYETQAIENGKADYSSYWLFKVAEKPDTQRNGMSLEIEDNLSIIISYEYAELFSHLLKQIKQENAKDF